MNLICFSHLRWHFVYQRPQHLMSRFAGLYNVYFIEECVYGNEPDGYTISITQENIRVITLRLKSNFPGEEAPRIQKILDHIFHKMEIKKDIFWYYTSMALKYTYAYQPLLTIYDCMDELSAFMYAPKELTSLEALLIKKADIMFTGGHHLFQAKKNLHGNIYCFPSSIDKRHFAQAREKQIDPDDQQMIPSPRLGFFGVLDERFDCRLIDEVAARRPNWQFILLGPIVKIDQEVLPKADNIHYLGAKSYDELPHYLSNWDIALIPFAINDSTRYISPTKTPEYLAAGKPVISTAIADVATPYGDQGLVHIAHNADQFIELAEEELSEKSRKEWLTNVDRFLRPMSWTSVWKDMHGIIEKTLRAQERENEKEKEAYV